MFLTRQKIAARPGLGKGYVVIGFGFGFGF